MHPHSHSHVLQLDIQGTPQAWISLEHAASHVASGAVAWVEGVGPLATLRGGFNVARGRQSAIDVHPIIALHGASRVNLFDVVPAFSKGKLFRRDRMTCAYCGQLPGVNYLELRVSSRRNVTRRPVVVSAPSFPLQFNGWRLWACGRRLRRWATQAAQRRVVHGRSRCAAGASSTCP
jgi:hypothetical protein